MTIYRDQLEAVYKLIEKPEAWTQNVYARNAVGDSVEIVSNMAVCWCLRGAVLKITSGMFDCSLCELFDIGSVLDFNDAPDRKHAEVLELLKSAIDRAKVRP